MICLDVDGVLNAWQLYQLGQFGLDIDYDDWPIGEWEIVKVFNDLT